VDPLADHAPAWTPYRYGFNNPILYIDPDGLFESRDAALDYAKENDIKIRPESFIGKLFTSGSRSNIVEHSDGTFAIESGITSISDFGGDLGIVEAARISPNDLMEVEIEGNIVFGKSFNATLRDGSEVDISPQGGIAPVGGRGTTPSIASVKKALKEIHKLVGKLPKGKPGKFGSPQRGNQTKGYRLDKKGHPNTNNPNETGPHINWWDFSKGKWNKGKGPGRKGAVPID